MSSSSAKPGWLILIIWLAIFYFVYLLFDKLIELQFNPNQQVQSVVHDHGMVEITLQRNKQGHYVTQGFVNGQAVTFLLDTGASNVAVPQALADQLGLQKMGQEFYNTANGVTSGYQTRLQQVALGQIKMHDVRGSIVPNMEEGVILLGMTFLKHLEFTQRGDILILRQNVHGQ